MVISTFRHQLSNFNDIWCADSYCDPEKSHMTKNQNSHYGGHFWLLVFTARRRVSARSLLSPGVHLSVCPSFTLAHSIHTAEDIVKRLCRPGSHIILVFVHQRRYPIPRGTFLTGTQNTRERENFAIFDWNRCLVSETMPCNLNRNSGSHMRSTVIIYFLFFFECVGVATIWWWKIKMYNGDILNDLDGPLARFSRSRHIWSRISQKQCV